MKYRVEPDLAAEHGSMGHVSPSLKVSLDKSLNASRNGVFVSDALGQKS